MIEYLMEVAKIAVGVTIGTLIGSYVMEWRIKKALKRYAPLLILLLGGVSSGAEKERNKLERKVQETEDQVS
jgi:uncharacterized membrane protein YfcA